MNLPPFILLLATVFWGWQSGNLWLGVLAGILLEGGHVRRWQRPFPTRLFHRASNLCALLFVAVAAYFLVRMELPQSVLATVRWTPLLLLPLMLAVLYGGLAQVPLSTVSSIARWRSRQTQAPQAQIEMGVPYVALWLLAAGVSNQPGPGFYLGLVAISGWLLWGIRPRERSPWPWAAMLLCAALLGAALDLGLYRLQGVLEQGMMDWFAGDGDEDPQRTETELGHSGQLKLSGTTVLQVHTARPLLQPLLLKTASYNYYSGTSWLVAGNRAFQTLPREPGQAFAWRVAAAAAAQQISIATTTSRLTSVLALPQGSSMIESAQFMHLDRNRLGTIQATLEKGFYSYQAAYQAEGQDHSAPGAQDLLLPRSEAAVLQGLVQQLHLTKLPAAEVLLRVKAHFAAHYRYSTVRGGTKSGNTALADFLLRDHRGHCEHFATASVLLLRAAGVPARYAVGYLVQEPNRFGSGYVVRQRHAHAWTVAYVDGAWQNFDTTPASWPTLEQQGASFWEPLFDTVGWLWYQIRQWQFTQTQMLVAAMLVLLVIFVRPKLRAWRNGRKHGKAAGKFSHKAAPVWVIEEVPEPAFYAIEALLATRGMARPRQEPLSHWQARIASQLPADANQALADLLRLHYRCRFGPQPVPATDRARLRDGCRDWLARFGGKQ